MAYRMCVIAALAALAAAPVAAQDAAQDGGIRFMRVPDAGTTGSRINIQITPEDVERQGAPDEVVSPLGEVLAAVEASSTTSSPASAWFWAAVSSAMPADPARFWAAQEHLAIAPEAAGLGAPRLNTVSRIAEDHGRAILAATIGTQVSPAFVLAVIAAESAGNTDAVSGAGAQGLMQLIPATAERFGVEDAMDPAQNIAGGVAYLDWLMGEFDRDPILVLAAYNAGEGAVTRAGGVPEYDETRTYVPRVLAAWGLARGLCNTPPELVSDGCVFAVMN